MTFYTNSPALSENIATSIERIEANLAHLYAALGNEHTGLTTTATAVTHADIVSGYRACGIISRTLSDASTGTPDDHSLSFTPKLVLFDWVSRNTNLAITSGNGYYDGTDGKCVQTWYIGSIAQASGGSVVPMQIYDDSATDYQYAVCAFGTNKFTLDWTKVGAPSGVAYIRYTAFG
jgi:hypothetical protein